MKFKEGDIIIRHKVSKIIAIVTDEKHHGMQVVKVLFGKNKGNERHTIEEDWWDFYKPEFKPGDWVEKIYEPHEWNMPVGNVVKLTKVIGGCIEYKHKGDDYLSRRPYHYVKVDPPEESFQARWRKLYTEEDNLLHIDHIAERTESRSHFAKPIGQHFDFIVYDDNIKENPMARIGRKAETKLEKEALKRAKKEAIDNEIAEKQSVYKERMASYIVALKDLKRIKAHVKDLEDTLDIKPDERKQLSE